MIEAADIEDQVTLKNALDMDDFEANFYSKNREKFKKIEEDLRAGRRSKVRFMKQLKLSYFKLSLSCLAVITLIMVYVPVFFGHLEIKDSLFHQVFSLLLMLAFLLSAPAIGMLGIPEAPFSTLAALKAVLFFQLPEKEKTDWIINEDFFNRWLNYLSKNSDSFNGVLMDKSYLMAGDSIVGVEMEFEAIKMNHNGDLA